MFTLSPSPISKVYIATGVVDKRLKKTDSGRFKHGELLFMLLWCVEICYRTVCVRKNEGKGLDGWMAEQMHTIRDSVKHPCTESMADTSPNFCRIHRHPSPFVPANSSPTDSWLAANSSLTSFTPRGQTCPRARFRRSSRLSTRARKTALLLLASEHTSVVDEALDLLSSTMMRPHRRSSSRNTD